MTLIKSISGIRGTIGGAAGSGLTPPDIVKYTSAFARLVCQASNSTLVIGRDARPSGEMVGGLVCHTLTAMGVKVIDLGLSTTPTVEMAVAYHQAAGGIIITASHNPVEWNALKLLNHRGEFISAREGARVLELAEQPGDYAPVNKLGAVHPDNRALDRHLEAILALPEVDREAIAAAGLRVAVDAVNSTGGIAVPRLLQALGISEIKELYCTPNGQFPHNPEPLPDHLEDICHTVREGRYDLGIVVDPDVDRLALVCEDGSLFGEEYTLVAVADYILSRSPGNTVSNLSSTRALRDITLAHGGQHYAAAVGEVNVVEKMKETKAVIGGEGNGGIIFPALHYGRDALVGIALFLSHLARKGTTASALRSSYPNYFMAKEKVALTEGLDVNNLLADVAARYASHQPDTTDGVKIDFDDRWVHLRKSNTEPIIRVYTEAPTAEEAGALAGEMIEAITALSGNRS